MPSITLVRDSGYADRLRAYDVILDGIAIGAIANGETKAFSVSAGQHQLRLKIDWCGSNVVEFTVEGDEHPTFYARSNLRGLRVHLALWYALFARNKYLLLERAITGL